VALWRRRRLIRWESLDVLYGLGKEPGTGVSSFEDTVIAQVDLRAALARCSAQDRACFLLSEAHELSAAEVGQILGASPESIRKRLSRTKQRLRRFYQAQRPAAEEASHD
jgi:RNA polymerase sigma factor (sigma-70 family)